MKETMRYGFILALICIIAAGLLAGVNMLTGPKIFAQALAEEQAGLKEVMPMAAKFIAVHPHTKDFGVGVKPDADKETLYYKAFDSRDKLIGFVFKAGGKGYSGVIETLVGIFLDQKISAIKVLSQNETPGLGAKITESKFRNQFNSRNSLDLSSVEAISGATISSRAVMNSIMKKAQEIKELIKNDPFDSAQGHAERTEGESKHEK